jgi:hypothetical protein
MLFIEGNKFVQKPDVARLEFIRNYVIAKKAETRLISSGSAEFENFENI